MSTVVSNLAWYVTGLTPAQKAVLVALADHAHEDGTNAFPGVERLMVKTSYAERTVRRALSDLRKMKLIHIQKRASRHFPTTYDLDLPEMQAKQHLDLPENTVDLPEMQVSNGLDLPENTVDLPETTFRPARNAPKPSYNRQEPSVVDDVATTAPTNGHFNDEESLYATKVMEVMDRWGQITGRGLPPDKEERVRNYFEPVNTLLIRVDWDVGEAVRLMMEKRKEMLREGKTPFRPAAVVPYLVAEMDKPTGTAWYEFEVEDDLAFK